MSSLPAKWAVGCQQSRKANTLGSIHGLPFFRLSHDDGGRYRYSGYIGFARFNCHNMVAMFAALALISLLSDACARPQSYAIWAADSGIARGQGNGLDPNGNAIVAYEHGEFQWSLRQLYELTGNRSYFDYIQRGVDNIVFNNGTVHGGYRRAR